MALLAKTTMDTSFTRSELRAAARVERHDAAEAVRACALVEHVAVRVRRRVQVQAHCALRVRLVGHAVQPDRVVDVRHVVRQQNSRARLDEGLADLLAREMMQFISETDLATSMVAGAW